MRVTRPLLVHEIRSVTDRVLHCERSARIAENGDTIPVATGKAAFRREFAGSWIGCREHPVYACSASISRVRFNRFAMGPFHNARMEQSPNYYRTGLASMLGVFLKVCGWVDWHIPSRSFDLPSRVMRDVHRSVAAGTRQGRHCYASEWLTTSNSRVLAGAAGDDMGATTHFWLGLVEVASIKGRENLVAVAIGQHAGAVDIFLVARRNAQRCAMC